MDRRSFLSASLATLIGAEASAASHDMLGPLESELPDHTHDMLGEPESEPEAVAVARPKKSRKPVVYVYHSPQCPPCVRLEKDEAAGLFPEIEFRWMNDLPDWVVATPALVWKNRKNVWEYRFEYAGAAKFRAIWRKSMQVIVAPARATVAVVRAPVRMVANNYRPRWTWPGNLGAHLRNAHRVNTAGMSQDQMEATHDNLHEGRGVMRIAQPRQSRPVFWRGRGRSGGCPGGVCPR